MLITVRCRLKGRSTGSAGRCCCWDPGHQSNTSLHLAEWRQESSPRGIEGASVRRPDGTSEWISWTDVIENSDDGVIGGLCGACPAGVVSGHHTCLS